VNTLNHKDPDWKEFVHKLKTQWKSLWRTRINDKLRAEGIASQDYSLLFVERGEVIIATRDYKPPNFMEILQQHNPPDIHRLVPPPPSVGGWGKFIRTVLRGQREFTKRGRPVPRKPTPPPGQQLKKGGRGWLHFRMRQSL